MAKQSQRVCRAQMCKCNIHPSVCACIPSTKMSSHPLRCTNCGERLYRSAKSGSAFPDLDQVSWNAWQASNEDAY